MFKNLLGYQSAVLPYLALAQFLARTLKRDPYGHRTVIQKIALGGIIGTGMVVAAIVIGQRLKTGATDATLIPDNPVFF